jgi:hypothetical protein
VLQCRAQIETIDAVCGPCASLVWLLVYHSCHAEWCKWVCEVVVLLIVHARPRIDGAVRVPWTQLIDNYLCLWHDCLEEHVCRELGVGCDTRGYDSVLGVPDCALRGILSMNSWGYKFYFGLNLGEKGL